MKKLLTYLNLLLGVASLALAGCHSQKVSQKAEEQPEPQEIREPKVICMYGVPATPDQELSDTTVTRRPQSKDPEDSGRVMLKYGVPNPRVSE